MTDKELLREISTYLKRCIRETRNGGWSTHQTKSQQDMADRIDLHLYRADDLRFSDETRRW